MKQLRLFAIIALAILASCTGGKERIPADAPGYVNGKPVHPTIKIGKPYRVYGKSYAPRYEPDYEEEGEASWYGPNFHGKSTANGEEFNQWAMTGAHRTLPLPSMVRVENLDNGKSAMVRINDRGPFAHDRIIDLSRGAAEELGMIGSGTAHVKVTYLKDETEQYIARLNLQKPAEWVDDETVIAAGPSPTVAAAPTSSVVVESLAPIAVASSDLPPLVERGDREAMPGTMGAPGDQFGYTQDAFSALGFDKPSAAVPATSGLPANAPFQVIRYTPPPVEASKPSASHAPIIPAQVPPDQDSYFVQVGSFSDKANALKLAEKLTQLAAVDITDIEVNGRIWHRVRVGPTYHPGLAEELRDRVASMGAPDARVLKNPEM